MAVLQYNPFQGDGSAGETGVKAVPPGPAAARVVARNGRVLMPSSLQGSIIAVSYEARGGDVMPFTRTHTALRARLEQLDKEAPE